MARAVAESAVSERRVDPEDLILTGKKGRYGQREETMKPQVLTAQSGFFKSGKMKTILWNLTSEMIGVYLWFLKFSNVLLKLIQ